MYYYDDLFADTELPSAISQWLLSIESQIATQFEDDAHGKMAEWRDAVSQMPYMLPSVIEFDRLVQVGVASDIDLATSQELAVQLMRLHPWRKGPFSLFGIDLDTEWRSDWKWDRLKDAIRPLDGKRVLDVGCGNGYHCWRMLGAGARHVVGLDPFLIYVMQFHAVKKLVGRAPVHVIPLGIEALAPEMRAFDTVFSMGVLYHRQSPFEHFMTLRDALRPGGELVLETLVIDGGLGETLVPEGRYAQMRNVWFLPSVLTLESWLRKCRFTNIKVVDVTPTTTAEQRPTSWMTFHSLAHYLDPTDAKKTIEGYPAPIRAVITADAPK